MSSDRTEHQSSEALRKSRDLSLESTRPPAEIPGYKLTKFIGSGAYGEVWSATDLNTGRKVAVKFYTRRSNADIQMLAQEVQKLVVLSNDSYVVGLLDVGWDATPPYYVMDYIETGSLEDRLKNGNVMPTAEAIELFQNVSTVMMNLHAKGILHCDLKPGNVLLDQEGKPRIADFGQSRLSTEKTSALGTLFFMAPEQADMDAIPDAGWDVYGLGALLYCMLTGKPPYYSPELAKKIETNNDIGSRLESYRNSLLSSSVPTDHRQVPGVDRGLADIIDRCIAADPKKRFNNVQSLLIALRQRELTRARRPLMLLGLLGPILLMGVVTFFGRWAFNRAMARTKTAVTVRAQSSNNYAAKLAARSASEQVEEYFRAVRQLSKQDNFNDLFDSVMADEELTKLRAQIADPSLNSEKGVEQNDEIKAIREAVKSHELRTDLQNLLAPRLSNKENEYPKAASWFVSDRFGNQIASVFEGGENITLCNNYAYRTYFTGQDEDLDKSAPEIDFANGDIEKLKQRPIIDQPHLSAVFQSKQSKTWKVAFSMPIRRYNEVQGILAVTVDLGELIDFQNNDSQYVMLVDERRGVKTSVILEHPLFKTVLEEQKAASKNLQPVLPDELAKTTIDLTSSDVIPFIDPVGKTSYGIENKYDRESIISREPVKVQSLGLMSIVDDATKKSGDEVNDQDSHQVTGLEVVAVQDYNSVLEDVSKLGSEIGRLAAIAGLVALGLVLGMLWFVNRMMRESRERLARSFSPNMESVISMQSMDTIAAVKSPDSTGYRVQTQKLPDALDETEDFHK
jgi:serine/threonine protein kinase